MALTVSSAEATTSAVGSLTYGGQHLSTDDSGHLRTDVVPANGGRPSVHKEVLTPVAKTGARASLCALGRPLFAGAVSVHRWPLSSVLRW